MFHPHAELRVVSPEIGYGIFATATIPRGTIVYAQDAMEIVFAPGNPMIQDPVYGPIIDKYTFIDAQGNHVLSWDIAKYVNHACDPNSMSTGYGFEIAVRDIAPGEEITDEYGIFNLPRPMPCMCGCANCRGRVDAADFDDLAEGWDTTLRDALAGFNRVAQPLLAFVDRRTHRALMTYLNNGKGYRSIRNLKRSEPLSEPMISTAGSRRRRRVGRPDGELAVVHAKTLPSVDSVPSAL